MYLLLSPTKFIPLSDCGVKQALAGAMEHHPIVMEDHHGVVDAHFDVNKKNLTLEQ